MVILVMILVTVSVFAQEKKTQLPMNISYFGETLIHPGFVVGYENNFHKWFNYTLSVGTYVQQRHHTGLFFEAGINWRYTFSFGYSIELGVGLGYLHTWQHGGKTYTVSDDGVVSEKMVLGSPSFMPSIKLGLLGWDFRKKTNVPLRINIDGIIFGQLPYNNGFMPHFAIKSGATYYFELPRKGN
jgi:hypothetical protein